MHKKVFIIGNGFDLDLGWNTRYKDFAESDFWPLRGKKPDCSMGTYLHTKVDLERWYDLENVLKEYACDGSWRSQADPKDEPFFSELKSSLMAFIKNEEKAKIKQDSLAVHVLKAIVENEYFSSIYTFNYTDLHKVAKEAKIHPDFNVQSVHGSVSDDNIILGISDISSIVRGYSYLRKVFSPYYRSHHIRFDLQECDEVVFFGHSLGDNDYPYFSDFFDAQCQCGTRSQSKRITIFTKNDSSRIQILEQLHYMTAGNTERLINDNEFSILMSDNRDEDLLNQFYNHLAKESKANEKLYQIDFSRGRL